MAKSMQKIKLCGMMRECDIRYANDAKPDYVGFVFADTRRKISVETAKQFRKMLHPDILAVGVFVDADVAYVAELLESGIIDLAQLHGQEDAEYIANIRAISTKPLIKAVKVQTISQIQKAAQLDVDYLLLDTYKKGVLGGTGEMFDWNLIEEARRLGGDGTSAKTVFGKPYFLAGGLTIANLQEAMKQQSFGLDISSGIETDGYKDREKMLSAVKVIRGGKTMSKGRFGIHGGQYVPETIMNAVNELEETYKKYKDDPEFNRELTEMYNEYAGRPSRLYYAERMSKDLGGAKIYLKREDLNHTGSHKINNVIGQMLLAKRMGKTRVIAETGAGQHGVATATVAAMMGMECEIFMGKEDTIRQALNVYRMRLLGAKVHPVESGTATLKDAVSETFREWTSRIEDTHYVLGSVMGPYPFPTIVRDFQSVISREIKQQLMEKEGRLPDAVLACVGGGSNAMGAFYHFIEDKSVRLIGCEAAGRGIDTYETAATINTGRLGIFHGMKSYFCQDDYGQIAPVYSISAGLDYPGIGPEHAYLHDTGRAEYVAVTDDEAVEAFEYLSRIEGIIPAIESAHAVAHAMKLAPQMNQDQIMVINISGRGDKDVAAIARYRGEDLHE